MSTNTTIQILRSYANSTPLTLEDGEQAYSFVSGKLFIGNNTNKVITTGGQYYTNIIDSANNQNIPNTLVKRSANGSVDLGRITTTFSPSTPVDVTSKQYVDSTIALARNEIFFGVVGNTGYSNVLTLSDGVNVTANNRQVARFRESQIYFDKDFTVTGNIYIQNEVATENITAQNIIAYDQFYAGIATSLATPLPNLIAQFTGNTDSYVQVNVENIDPHGSGDYVVTADVGTDTTFYIDLGMQSSNAELGTLKPLDGYLYVEGNTGQPGGNLIIGTVSGTPGLQTRFINGGYDDANVIMTLDSGGVLVVGDLEATTFSGNTIDNLYTAIDDANTYQSSSLQSANTWLQANDFYTLTTAKSYTNVANSYNITFTQNYTNTANAFLQANDATTLGIALNYTDVTKLALQNEITANLVTAKAYTDTANASLKLYSEANTGAALAAAKVYTDAANTFNKNYTDTANVYLQLYAEANTGAALAEAKAYTDTANTFNRNYTNTANTFNRNYTNTANTWLQANDFTTWTTSQTYTNTANTFNTNYTDTANTNLRLYAEANTGAALAAAKVYTDTANTFNKNYTDTANTFNKNYTDTANTNLRLYAEANTGAALAAGKVYTDTANTFNKNYTDTANTFNTNYTDTANTNLRLYAEANTGAALAAAKVYTDTANTYLDNKKVNRNGDTITGELIINNPSGDTALQVSGNVSISKNLIVSGNLAIFGNTTSFGTQTLEIVDPMILLATGNYTTDFLDIGFAGSYNDGANAHTGLFRESTMKEWYFFEGYTPEVSGNNNINIEDASFRKSNVNVNYVKGNLIGSTAVVNGIELYNYSTAGFAQANSASAVANYAANKANGSVQTAFVTISANGTSITATTNTDTITITSATANGINILNPASKTIDFGLRNSGVTSGSYSYPSLNVDQFGRVTTITSQTPVTTFNTRNGTVTLNYSDVTGALGYYPLSNTGNTISGSYTGATNIGTDTLTANTINLITGFITTNTYTTTSISQITLDSFNASTYRSAKYEVQITSSTKYHVLEIRIVHNGTNSWITQYGEIWTNGTLGTFSTDVSAGNVTLLFTPENSATTIKLIRSLITV